MQAFVRFVMASNAEDILNALNNGNVSASLLDALMELGGTELSSVRAVRDFNKRECVCCCNDDNDGSDNDDDNSECTCVFRKGLIMSAATKRAILTRLEASGVPLTHSDLDWTRREDWQRHFVPTMRSDDADGMNAFVVGLYRRSAEDVASMAEQRAVFLFSMTANSYNMLRIMSGLGGLAYAQ